MVSRVARSRRINRATSASVIQMGRARPITSSAKARKLCRFRSRPCLGGFRLGVPVRNDLNTRKQALGPYVAHHRMIKQSLELRLGTSANVFRIFDHPALEQLDDLQCDGRAGRMARIGRQAELGTGGGAGLRQSPPLRRVRQRQAQRRSTSRNRCRR